LDNLSLQWADLSYALLNHTSLVNVDFFGSVLHKANLSHTNLSRSNMRRIDLSDVILDGANLSFATVEEEDWMAQLHRWRISTAAEVMKEYRIIADTTNRTHYMLIKNEK
jgi:uncharacterized protein YjbI with pentapeptide repeats